ncbi:hypothetical protein EYF80_006024 [Liparis tanakae]|uniref:Uncharacterized protein n=1 Tax=Liparis tanakae TaxID=230148 RepID=A0A4Z2J2A4_9TELE|nr:hypothetical protein EYF80_006024 [Liparis tanakae]
MGSEPSLDLQLSLTSLPSRSLPSIQHVGLEGLTYSPESVSSRSLISREASPPRYSPAKDRRLASLLVASLVYTWPPKKVRATAVAMVISDVASEYSYGSHSMSREPDDGNWWWQGKVALSPTTFFISVWAPTDSRPNRTEEERVAKDTEVTYPFEPVTRKDTSMAAISPELGITSSRPPDVSKRNAHAATSEGAEKIETRCMELGCSLLARPIFHSPKLDSNKVWH